MELVARYYDGLIERMELVARYSAIRPDDICTGNRHYYRTRTSTFKADVED